MVSLFFVALSFYHCFEPLITNSPPKKKYSEFCMFVVMMSWVNIRVSLETDSLFVHLSVAATLAVFYLVTIVPAWRALPPGFFHFVIGMIILFLAYNWAIKWGARRLRKYLWNQNDDLLEELMKELEARHKEGLSKEVASPAMRKDDVSIDGDDKESLSHEPREKETPRKKDKMTSASEDQRLRIVSIVDNLEDDQDLVRRRMDEAIKRKLEAAESEEKGIHRSNSNGSSHKGEKSEDATIQPANGKELETKTDEENKKDL